MYYIYKTCTGDPYISLEMVPDSELNCSVCGRKWEFLNKVFSLSEIVDTVNNSDCQFSHLSASEVSEICGDSLTYSPKYGMIINGE